MKLAIVLRAMYVLNTFAVGFKCFEKKKKKKRIRVQRRSNKGSAERWNIVWFEHTLTSLSALNNACFQNKEWQRWQADGSHHAITETLRARGTSTCFVSCTSNVHKKKTASISQSSEIFICNYILIFGVILYCVTSNVPALHIWIPRWNKITCS